MLFLTFLSVTEIILGIVGACGLAKSQGTVENVAWGVATIKTSPDESTMWLGLAAVAYDLQDTSSGISVTNEGVDDWDKFCTNVALQNPDNSKCKDCKDAGTGLYMSAVIGVFSKLGQLSTDLTRSSHETDVACQKIFGVCTGIIGAISTLMTLQTWQTACHDAFPESIYGFSVDMKYGAGFICFWICTVGGILDGLVHLVVPLPADKYPDEDEKQIGSEMAGTTDTA